MNPYRGTSDHPGASATARGQRGTWVLAGVYPSSMTAKSAARHITTGSPKFPYYQPRGSYEAYAAPAGDVEAVWVRYVAGDQPVPPLPERMTVRIRHDGDEQGYDGVGVVTVTITTRCPRCGGPRGWDTVRSYVFHHDGDRYSVDRWTNPCGHVDVYDAVLYESRARQLPNPVDLDQAVAQGLAAGEPAPVALVLAVANQHRSMGGAQAARLLDEHGHHDAAAILRSEVTSRQGHLSAKQGACLLRDLTAPLPSPSLPDTNTEIRA